METKKCIKCQEIKPLSEYLKKSKYYYRKCKKCVYEDLKKKHEDLLKLKEKKCSCCKEVRLINMFYVSNGIMKAECKICANNKKLIREKAKREKDKSKHKPLVKRVKAKEKESESIFEQEKKLIKEAKKLSKDNKQTEEWKLANGWSWITEEVPFTKTTTRKQRVLRKLKK